MEDLDNITTSIFFNQIQQNKNIKSKSSRINNKTIDLAELILSEFFKLWRDLSTIIVCPTEEAIGNFEDIRTYQNMQKLFTIPPNFHQTQQNVQQKMWIMTLL